MARSIVDVALALDAVIGPDPTDLRSLPMPEVSWAGAVRDPSVPLQVAWSPTLGYATPDPEVLSACLAAVARLEDLGAQVVEVDDVFAADPLLTWVAMTGTYLRRTLRGVDALDGDDVDPSLRPALEWASSLSAVELAEAEDECHRLNLRLVDLFADVRLLVTPTVATLAPRSGGQGVLDGVETANWVQYTYPFNCTRSPAGTVPVGVSSQGTPIGLQVVGPQHGDQVVLRAIAAMEVELGLPDPPRL
jgi:aspartyl-tRNA(Asn)/glutamyl-tRNA(Gln) amidotransferase subunit A